MKGLVDQIKRPVFTRNVETVFTSAGSKMITVRLLKLGPPRQYKSEGRTETIDSNIFKVANLDPGIVVYPGGCVMG